MYSLNRKNPVYLLFAAQGKKSQAHPKKNVFVLEIIPIR